jgi:hypothetical protein
MTPNRLCIEVPLKSGFDQVHVASTASEPNLAKTPFHGNLVLPVRFQADRNCTPFTLHGSGSWGLTWATKVSPSRHRLASLLQE